MARKKRKDPKPDQDGKFKVRKGKQIVKMSMDDIVRTCAGMSIAAEEDDHDFEVKPK